MPWKGFMMKEMYSMCLLNFKDTHYLVLTRQLLTCKSSNDCFLGNAI